MSRRSKGEGTLYARRDKTGKVIGWTGQVQLGYEGERRLRKTVTAKTQAEVRAKIREIEQAQDAGLVVRMNERMTVADFLQRWLVSIESTVRPKTLTMYRLHANRHIIPALGREQLASLNAETCQRFFNAKLRTDEHAGLAPKSVLHLRATLRTALNQALEWGYVRSNPVVKTRPPRLSPTTIRALTPDECRKLLAAVRGDRWEALYQVALGLGLRQGEILALQWEDIDFQTGRLWVRHSLQRVNGKLTLVEPKTAQSVRNLRMPGSVTAALLAHQNLQRNVELIASPYVFTGTTGAAIDARNLIRHFKSLLHKAHLPSGIRFHDLRHTVASLLLVDGATVKEVSELLGHSSPDMVNRVYSHVLPHRRDALADRMEAVLSA